MAPVADNTDKDPWLVECNNPAVNARRLRCSGNGVSTTKYSPVSFLPKALFEQFLRAANLYFVAVSAVACTPVSPIPPAPQIGPLLLVVAFSLMREAAEDRSRARADRNLNTRLVDVLRAEDRAWARTEWRLVAVGDLVRVRNGEPFPADLLLLASSDARGVCYVSTANVDGETNLKVQRACSWEPKPELLNSAAAAATLQVQVLCTPPNPSLGAFSGKLLFPDGVPGAAVASTEQLLLRGCSLRNTDCIIGVVIFAGWQTKVMMNIPPYRPCKRSSLEGRLDRLILLLFALLLLLCAGAAIGYGYHGDPGAVYLLGTDDTNLAEEYLGWADNLHHRSVAVVLSIFTFFTLLSPIIPISLYLVVEVVRFVHCTYFIANDRRMYHKGSAGVVAHSSNLCEDLGRIEYILSDKTGTLTCNSMNFLKCSIAGVVYGSGSTELGATVSRSRRGGEGVQGSDKACSFKDARLMSGAWRNEPDPWACLYFFRCLAICHTVLPEASADSRSVTYKAASPDEVALVAAAKDFGFVFHHRNSAGVRILEQHVEQVGVERDVEYGILNVLEFDSTRKRQSVVCRHPDGKLVLYCKGADNVILARMAGVGNQHQAATREHLEMFGADGLRTLCVAYRELSTQEYDSWNAMYLQAKAVGTVDRVADLIERNLFLLGCTAIEDKLQEGVPTCIRSLSAAGIKLWMLTGDKTETAINVAYACGLLTNDIRQLVVVNSVAAGISKKEELDKLVWILLREAILEAQCSPNDPLALVIDGECLTCALEEGGRVLLLALVLKCKAVVCSRVSPLQKALLTSLVRDGAGKLTLCIGDGANDVEMIQAAHIGVGINGQEGLQAVMASDFAIARFHFLTNLLLVHGRWSYLRISKVISFFLYKNLSFALTQFWFSLHTLFSAQQFYDNWYMSLYSVLFTTFPAIVVGVLDKDVGRNTSKNYPELYQAGISNTFFTWKSRALWFTSAFYHSLVLFYLPVAAGTSAQTRAGFMFGIWEISTLTSTCLITTVSLRLLMACDYLTMWHCISVIASILLWIVFAMVYGGVKSWYDTWNLSGVILIVLRTWYFWQCLLLVPAVALAFDFLVEVVQRSFHPFDYQILQEHVELPPVAAAATKAALYKKHPENSDSVANERHHIFEMRKSAIAQKRKVSIEFVRKSNNLEQGVNKDMEIIRQTVFPCQTGATQIQSSTSIVPVVDGMIEQHDGEYDGTIQPSNMGSCEATLQVDVWPPSTVTAAYSRYTRGPYLETGASLSTHTIQQTYNVALGAPNGVRHRGESIQVATRAPNQVWQQFHNNQQSSWAPSSSLNEVWQQADDECQPTSRALRAPYNLSQRASSFQPDYLVYSSRPDEILAGTCQPDSWISPSVVNEVLHGAETSQPTPYETSDRETRDVLGLEQDVNPLKSIRSLEGVQRRKSKAIVVSSITRELQNNDGNCRTLSAILTRTNLGTSNKMDTETGSSFPELLHLKRIKNQETARTDIDRKQVCIKRIALAGRRLRTGLDIVCTRGQENRSHGHVEMLRKTIKARILPLTSRRAQSSLTKVLGQMSRRHTGFAFDSPNTGSLAEPGPMC